jgi:putative endonuclease
MSIVKPTVVATRRPQPSHNEARTRTRQEAERRGRLAEWIAASTLVLKGYRIIARRLRGPFGEIDLIAVRGRRLAFVEVKQRRSRDEATAALTPRQADRLGNAAERWLGENARYRDHVIGLDAILLGPRMLPRHIPNALNAW